MFRFFLVLVLYCCCFFDVCIFAQESNEDASATTESESSVPDALEVPGLDNSQVDVDPSLPEKKSRGLSDKARITLALSLLSTGLLVEAAGIFIGIEANSKFLEASKTQNDIDTAEDDADTSDLVSRFKQQQEDYQTLSYLSYGFISGGVVLLGTGMFFAIKQFVVTRQKQNSFETKRNTISSNTNGILLPPENNIFLFFYGNTLGIGIK